MCRPGDKKPLGLFIRVLPTAIPIPPFLIRTLRVAIRVLECVIRTLPVVIRALERAIRTLPGSISIPSPLIRILPVGIRKPAAGEQVFSAVIRAKTPTYGHCRSHTDCAGVRTGICDKEKGRTTVRPFEKSIFPISLQRFSHHRIHFQSRPGFSTWRDFPDRVYQCLAARRLFIAPGMRKTRNCKRTRHGPYHSIFLAEVITGVSQMTANSLPLFLPHLASFRENQTSSET